MTFFRYAIFSLFIAALPMQATQDITLKNNSNHDIKMIASTTFGESHHKRVYRGQSGTISIGTIECTKYIEFKFYDTPKHLYKNKRPVSWGQSYRVPLKDGRISNKSLAGFSVDDGRVYYNLGATWGAFYCSSFTITIDETGSEIKLSD